MKEKDIFIANGKKYQVCRMLKHTGEIEICQLKSGQLFILKESEIEKFKNPKVAFYIEEAI